MDNEDLFNFMEKMYNEMNNRFGEVNNRFGDIDKKFDEINKKLDAKADKTDIVRIEDKLDANSKALFDGYKQNYELIKDIKEQQKADEQILLDLKLSTDVLHSSRKKQNNKIIGIDR